MFQSNLNVHDKMQDRDNNEKVIIIMMNIIMATNNTKIVTDTVNIMCNIYEDKTKLPIADKNIVLEEILSVIHTGLLALSKNPTPKMDIKDRIFHIIDDHFKCYGIETEGINMISGAAACFKKDFRNNINNYWPKIMEGLEQT